MIKELLTEKSIIYLKNKLQKLYPNHNWLETINNLLQKHSNKENKVFDSIFLNNLTYILRGNVKSSYSEFGVEDDSMIDIWKIILENEILYKSSVTLQTPSDNELYNISLKYGMWVATSISKYSNILRKILSYYRIPVKSDTETIISCDSILPERTSNSSAETFYILPYAIADSPEEVSANIIILNLMNCITGDTITNPAIPYNPVRFNIQLKK
jgi:hypothetical protein